MSDLDGDRRTSSPLFNKLQCARFIGISTRQLDRLGQRADGPRRTRIGGRVFYAKADLERWLASCAEGTNVD